MKPQDEIQVRRLKLKAQKEHLEALLNKRSRLDYEIRLLKKRLHDSQKSGLKYLGQTYKNEGLGVKEDAYTFVREEAFMSQVSSELFEELELFDAELVDLVEVLQRTS